MRPSCERADTEAGLKSSVEGVGTKGRQTIVKDHYPVGAVPVTVAVKVNVAPPAEGLAPAVSAKAVAVEAPEEPTVTVPNPAKCTSSW